VDELLHPPTSVELRRGALAVSVLHDVDLEPAPLGVVLSGEPTVWISWGECRLAFGVEHPESDTGRHRLARWLRARRWAADAGPVELADLLRPVGLPYDHALHPGRAWIRQRVLGNALHLGLGAAGLDPADPDGVVLLPPPALELAGVDADAAWLEATTYLEDMGRLAADRLTRDPKGHLRPIGDCDAVTLLGARSLRAHLADRQGGLGVAVVPMRRRGWTDLGLIDPAFGPAAAAATEPFERGFPRPLLVTADEVTIVPAGGSPAKLALDTPLVTGQWLKDVLYR
jgi:hypothetical protein